MTGYVYKHTNKLDGKVYIGQTIQDPIRRWGHDGINYKNQRYFYRAIILHGWDNFDHEILATVEANNKNSLSKELLLLENKYILKYKSMLSDKGYNTSVSNLTRLTATSKRVIKLHMKNGHSFEEALELYRIRKCKKK